MGMKWKWWSSQDEHAISIKSYNNECGTRMMGGNDNDQASAKWNGTKSNGDVHYMGWK